MRKKIKTGLREVVIRAEGKRKKLLKGEKGGAGGEILIADKKEGRKSKKGS